MFPLLVSLALAAEPAPPATPPATTSNAPPTATPNPATPPATTAEGQAAPTAETSTAATPGDPASVPAPVKVPTSDAAKLVDAIAAIQRVHGAEVLVGAAGPDAEATLLSLGEKLPDGARRFVRVGILGAPESEVTRALGEAKLACGVRVAPTDGGWEVRAVGACAPLAPDAAIVAALAAPPDKDTLERTWREQALVRVNLGDGADVPWTVRDGKGRTLTAVELARLTGDTRTQSVLAKESRRARRVSLGFASIGVGLGLGALGAIVVMGGEEPIYTDYEPNVADYGTPEEFEAAQTAAAYLFQTDLHNWEVRREDAAWASATLAGAALLAGAASPLANDAARARQREIAWHWTPEAADAHLATYNDSLRVKIGLPSMIPVKADALPAPVKPVDLPEADEEEDAADEPSAPAPVSGPLDLGDTEDLDAPDAPPAPKKEAR